MDDGLVVAQGTLEECRAGLLTSPLLALLESQDAPQVVDATDEHNKQEYTGGVLAAHAPAAGRTLVEDETKQMGSVSWAIYKVYQLATGGVLFWAMVIVTRLVLLRLSIGADNVLRLWGTGRPEAWSQSHIWDLRGAPALLTGMAIPVDLADRESLLKAASTSLNSKIVSQYSALLAPIAVDAVLRVIDPASAKNVDLRDVRVVKKVGGTIDDTELIDGLVLTQNVIKSAGGPSRVEKAKIALVQFQLSPPKPDMENQIVVNDYRQMDKILKEERTYLLNMCKKIKKAGANVILIQKSILRDAVNDLSLHFLAKLKIMVIKDIERDEVEFVCKSTGCKPIADIDSFTEDKLGYADVVEEVQSHGSRYVRFTGAKASAKTVSVIVRGANGLVLEEAERSLHDALCVMRCLVKKRALIAGGGAPEMEVSHQLAKHANTLTGMRQYCFQAFAEALEVIPTTLAENAGLNPIAIVTELRNRHALGETTAGINVRKGAITSILEENVIQPLLVCTSAIELAAETTRMVLKIDDIVTAR
ncbi:T-complex protein 1 subunit delta [Allomyces macrogynus ATCC 38327]|uniref:T-complex protein 1 subunit delta n=1 Tax=Allomyces macrogynus (strain ATCC 38327) TaxID=578462 RepID=A0A0L0STK5_ALLM3|nr:T-complex protein 1 subunit delta [Allomyces macrogynus ATCC 38327]|eukprot:KNE65654.1 T-complex protein 1 subunit delta [Allomyces macrogynus ATCC 38327]